MDKKKCKETSICFYSKDNKCKLKTYNCTKIYGDGKTGGRFREKIVHGVCKPDKCKPKIVINSFRQMNDW